jgi:hypothetical protein
MLYENGIYAEPVNFRTLSIHFTVLLLIIFFVAKYWRFNFLVVMNFSLMGYILATAAFLIFCRWRAE